MYQLDLAENLLDEEDRRLEEELINRLLDENLKLKYLLSEAFPQYKSVEKSRLHQWKPSKRSQHLEKKSEKRKRKSSRRSRRKREEEWHLGSPANNPNYKCKLCTNWMSGHCPFGKRCVFAHGDDELRSGGKKRRTRRRKL